jgi:hypothetical protein
MVLARVDATRTISNSGDMGRVISMKNELANVSPRFHRSITFGGYRRTIQPRISQLAGDCGDEGVL